MRVLVGVVAVALLLGGAWLLMGTPPVAQPGATATTATRTSSPAATRTSPRPTVAPATDAASGLRWVDLGSLPREASETMRLIRAGGPFPYDKDGAVFSNFERRLPKRPSGYYREFTVRTPGEGDRGARRIITGGPAFGVTNAEFYYTADHYASFERIRT